MRDRWIVFACLLLLILTTANAITDTNLISYYKLDEPSGTIAIDYVGYDNNGLYQGSYTLGNAGKINTAWTSSGSDSATNSIDIGTFNYKTNFSISLWVYGTPSIVDAGIFRLLKSSTECFVRSNVLFCDTAGSANQSTGYSWSGENWKHLVYTNTGTEQKVYVNNALIYTGNYTGTTGYDGNTLLGAWGYHNWAGKSIDEVSLWNRVLSASDVNDLYNSGAGLTCPFATTSTLDNNIKAYYKLDETTGATAIDYVGYDNNGTNVSSVPINQAGKINKAYGDFSTNDYIDLGSTVGQIKFNTLTPFSVCSWFNITSNSANNMIVTQSGNTDNMYQWYLFTDNSGIPKFALIRRGAVAYYAVSSAVSTGTWNHICGTYNGTSDTNGIKVYVNGVKGTDATWASGALTIGNLATALGNNIDLASSYNFNGKIDEVGIWDRNLTQAEVTELYNSGSGKTYPFSSTSNIGVVSSDFNYPINKDINAVMLKSTATTTMGVIHAWTWKLSNGTTIGTTQDLNYVTTQLTDLNICLTADANTGAFATTCKAFNTGDWNPPVTTFSSNQVTNTTINTLTFVCTDNNSGCKYLNYNIDANTWIQVANTDTKDINYSGAGSHSIQYFSTDNASVIAGNSDNNEVTKTSTFTTYGKATFRIKDQNSGLDLNGTQINFDGSDYVSGTNLYDFNLQEMPSTNTSYLFTISKTGYSTRYYQIDLNYFSGFDINFALLPDSVDADVPFKVYKTDQTTIFANTYVEVKDSDTNWTIGRLKTNATGEATFNLRADDSNYISVVNNGEFTYTPVTVSVLYPKNEETLVQITERWKIEITQNLYATYSDLNATKIIYLLPNTSLPYNIKISDMNGNYFSRTYAKTYPGNPLTDNLQPYLVSDATGLLTTITTKDASTNTAVPNITIKVFKYISGLGRTLVEQLNTDSKGQALALLVLNGEYEFEAYNGTTFIKTYNITATSSVIIIYLYSSGVPSDLNASGYNASFTPSGTGINKLNVGVATFTATIFNYGGLNTTYLVTLTQNGVTLDSETYTGTDLNKTFTLTRNWVDINKGPIQVRIVTSSGYGFQQTYSINDSFGTNYSILNGLQNLLRQDIGCPASGICFPLMIIGILISIGLVLYASILMGGFNGQASGLIFVISMVLFAYLNWIPYELIIGLVLIVLAFIVNERRG